MCSRIKVIESHISKDSLAVTRGQEDRLIDFYFTMYNVTHLARCIVCCFICLEFFFVPVNRVKH